MNPPCCNRDQSVTALLDVRVVEFTGCQWWFPDHRRHRRATHRPPVTENIHASSSRPRISGVIYSQYSYSLKSDGALKPNGGHQNDFDVTRAYINAIASLPGDVGGRVTLDVDGRKAATNQLSERLKYAYATWRPHGGPLMFKLGEQQTPWVDFEEAIWDYRMQGTTIFERNGYLSSSDFGFAVEGNYGKDAVDFIAGVYDGENYNNTPGDQRKDVEARVSVRLLKTNQKGRAGGLRISAYGQYGIPTGGGVRQRYIGELSYKSQSVLLAAIFGRTYDSTTGTSTKDLKGQTYGFYGWYGIPNTGVRLVGRVDVQDPDKDVEVDTPVVASNRQTRVIAGISYQLSPNLRIMGDFDLNALHGGVPNNAFNATRQLALFQSQLTF